VHLQINVFTCNLQVMAMKTKTLGVPTELLVRLETRAEQWNKTHRGRPVGLLGTATWADVMRIAAEEFLGKATRAPTKKARQ